MKETPLPKCMQFAIIMQNDAKMEIKKHQMYQLWREGQRLIPTTCFKS